MTATSDSRSRYRRSLRRRMNRPQSGLISERRTGLVSERRAHVSTPLRCVLAKRSHCVSSGFALSNALGCGNHRSANARRVPSDSISSITASIAFRSSLLPFRTMIAYRASEPGTTPQACNPPTTVEKYCAIGESSTTASISPALSAAYSSSFDSDSLTEAAVPSEFTRASAVVPRRTPTRAPLVFGESPRWYDGRLWIADWGAREIVAWDSDGAKTL
jgi:hypothetical protein